MARRSGSGTILRDLGNIAQVDLVLDGSIGGAEQPSTLLVVFSVAAPVALRINRLAVQPFTDRFISVGIRTAAGDAVPLGELGDAIVSDVANTPSNESAQRLPAGGYAFVISTSQWQQAPYRVRIHVSVPQSLQLAATGRASLVGAIGLKRLAGALKSKGGLRLKLGRTVRASSALSSRGGLQCGLIVAPAYAGGVTTSLAHAWFSDTETDFAVGSGSGLSWLTIPYQSSISGYLETGLSLADFRANPSRRLIFSAEAAATYDAHPEIGPSSAQVTTAIAPDYPEALFVNLINGSYRRKIRFLLPAGGDTQLLVWVEEVLYWNNDVVRDTELRPGLPPRYVASNYRSTSAHQRKVSVFVISQTACRQLRQAPSEFLAQLDQLLPPLDTFLVSRRLQVPGGGAAPAWVECLFPTFAIDSSSPSEGDRILCGDPEILFSNLLASYGMTLSLRASAGLGSPAIYALLQNSTTILSAPFYDRRSYTFAATCLPYRPASLPHLSPWFKDGAYQLYGTSFEAYQAAEAVTFRYGSWQGDLPADAATGVSSIDSRWQLIPDQLRLSEDRQYRFLLPTALISYDWGDAVSCRQSAAVSGFTGDDLSPAQPLSQPGQSLNPGGSRAMAGAGGLGISFLAATGSL